MVKVIALRPFRGDEGFVTPRTRLDVSERRAEALVKKKLVTYEVGAKMQPAGKNKMDPGAEGTKEAAATAAAAPTDQAPAGSQTGGAKPARSSQAGRRRSK